MLKPLPIALILAGLSAVPPAQSADAVQKSRPPVSQAWIDLATFSGGAPAASPGGMLGSIFGGGGAAKGGNAFGNTVNGTTGRWMDVTLTTRKNAQLKTATQAVPAASKLAPTLKLLAPEAEKATPGGTAYTWGDGKHEMPKGKMYLYWGCGADVRKGQPLVLDLSRMDMQSNKFFQNRGMNAAIPSPAPGRPAWPNNDDQRLLPEGASMAGEHGFTGEGVADGFRFNIDAAHDLMPAIALTQRDDGKAVVYAWQALPQARAYFLSSMGMRSMEAAQNGEMEMVYWTSSELPDMGMGLMNYQPDAAIQKWLKEKVLLQPKTTECAVPKEALSAMPMTRMIAYGDELNMAYPPRPKDPKVTWEPDWDVKVRLKSVATLQPGMGAMAAAAMASGQRDEGGQGAQPAQPAQPPSTKDRLLQAAPSAFDLLRGVLKK